MEALAKPLRDGAITPIEIELGPRELPMRQLYGTRGFLAWLDERARGHEPSTIESDITPLEQIDDLFYRYVAGRTLTHRREFRCVKVERNPVWEFKTPDVRIFGWFPMKDCFVAVYGDSADRVKDHDLYRGYRLEVRRIRREMGIEESLHGAGSVPKDVLSL
ncbi:hypothetical protein HCU64_24750 [Methylobacterium sp. C25]|uniref:hypothetical protein n=1 Tax=Methylobacterium sp. C25 TaxID=2721622 RepID=UPI001F29E55F|nr:hypothetical protein [Methylobacterium sp. C25]MCE4226954.1 hypothetical protein [Methylobacterium sp. C25]